MRGVVSRIPHHNAACRRIYTTPTKTNAVSSSHHTTHYYRIYCTRGLWSTVNPIVVSRVVAAQNGDCLGRRSMIVLHHHIQYFFRWRGRLLAYGRSWRSRASTGRLRAVAYLQKRLADRWNRGSPGVRISLRLLDQKFKNRNEQGQPPKYAVYATFSNSNGNEDRAFTVFGTIVPLKIIGGKMHTVWGKGFVNLSHHALASLFPLRDSSKRQVGRHMFLLYTIVVATVRTTIFLCSTSLRDR
jgi:hypothetical protein